MIVNHLCVCVVQVLLSRDDVLQLSGVQCVAEVLLHHSHYTQALLRADIAGQHMGLCVCVCVSCVCVTVLISDTGSDPSAGVKCVYKKYLQPTSSPMCKTCTWSGTGEQSALAVSHYSLMVLVRLQDAHTGSERHSQYSCELLARATGVCIAPVPPASPPVLTHL